MIRVCSSCGGPVSRHSGTGKCRACSVNVARRDEVAQLRSQGHSLREIGRRLGVSKQAVYQALGRIERPPFEETVRNCSYTIERLDRISRTRALGEEESLALERAIKLEGKYRRILARADREAS